MTRRRWRSLAGLVLAAVAGCVGTTGGEKFSFTAAAGGVERGAAGPLTFTNEYGWRVTLEQADFLIGPVYLNTIAPLGGSALLRWLSPVGVAHAHDDHLGSGRVVGELLGRVRFSALSPELVPFASSGVISTDRVRSAELFFYPPADVSPETRKISEAAVEVAGSAERDGARVRFRGKLVLDDTWLPDAEAGDRDNLSITSLRQVRGIPAAFTPAPGGRVEIRVDPARLFTSADFSVLATNPADLTDPEARALVQAKSGKFTTDQVMRVMFQGLRASKGTYVVAWKQP